MSKELSADVFAPYEEKEVTLIVPGNILPGHVHAVNKELGLLTLKCKNKKEGSDEDIFFTVPISRIEFLTNDTVKVQAIPPGALGGMLPPGMLKGLPGNGGLR